LDEKGITPEMVKNAGHPYKIKMVKNAGHPYKIKKEGSK